MLLNIKYLLKQETDMPVRFGQPPRSRTPAVQVGLLVSICARIHSL